MNTYDAIARGMETRNDRPMVFDWDKAALILMVRQPEEAMAGLEDDFEYTAGIIWKDGKPYTKDYTFLTSTWARPMLVVDGESIECWRYIDEAEGWSHDTKWPETARTIVEER